MDVAAYVSEHLDRFRNGDPDGAFHGLIHREFGLVPPLTQAYLSERAPDVKAFIVEVLWQQRDPAVIPVLGQAFLDADSRVWKEALNGLAALSSPPALDALRAARKRSFPTIDASTEFTVWLEEAIEQAEASLLDQPNE